MNKFEDDLARGCLPTGEPLECLYGMGWWTEMPEEESEPDPAELEAERRWIPVSERLPEDRATVLVAFTEYPEQIDILTATYYKRYEGFGGIDNWWNIEGWHSGNVTHWMPLPQPPEVQE